MKKIIIIKKNKSSAKDISNNELIDIFLKENNQNKWINKLYLNETFKYDKFIIKLLKRKLNGYKSQDIKKNRLELLQMFCKTYNHFIDFSKVEGA